jgi:hypothetical protein
VSLLCMTNDSPWQNLFHLQSPVNRSCRIITSKFEQGFAHGFCHLRQRDGQNQWTDHEVTVKNSGSRELPYCIFSLNMQYSHALHSHMHLSNSGACECANAALRPWSMSGKSRKQQTTKTRFIQRSVQIA